MLYRVTSCVVGTASEPAKTVGDVVSAVSATLQNRLFVRKAELVNPADVDSDKPLELLLTVDWGLGVPTNWAMVGDDLTGILKRDVDFYTDRDHRAREPHPDLVTVFEYNGGDEDNEERMSWFRDVAPACAGEATRLLEEDFKRNAADICEFACKVAWQSLEISIAAMGSWTRPEMTYTELLRRAEDFGAVDDGRLLRHAMAELDFYDDSVNFGSNLAPIDALLAVCHANRVADALDAVGHPAFWISVRDPEVLGLMRSLGMVPAAPQFKVGEKAEIWEEPSDEHRFGHWVECTITAVDDCAADLGRAHGSWWTYAAKVDGETCENVPEQRLRKA